MAQTGVLITITGGTIGVSTKEIVFQEGDSVTFTADSNGAMLLVSEEAAEILSPEPDFATEVPASGSVSFTFESAELRKYVVGVQKVDDPIPARIDGSSSPGSESILLIVPRKTRSGPDPITEGN